MKIYTIYTFIFPKKSFNKQINLALLKSDCIDQNTMRNTPNIKGLANYVKKAMGYYKKNFDELYNENDLKTFDFISYRTLTKNKSADSLISKKDKNLFTVNYKKINEQMWNKKVNGA